MRFLRAIFVFALLCLTSACARNNSANATPTRAESSAPTNTALATATDSATETATTGATATALAATAPPPTAAPTLALTRTSTPAVSISIDASQRHQVINGFGATVFPFDLEGVYRAHDASQPERVTVAAATRVEIARTLHQELGFTRARFFSGGFEPENDNADPNVFDWTHFTWDYHNISATGAKPFSDYVNLARAVGLKTWFPTFANNGAGEKWLRNPGANSLKPALADEYVEHLLALAIHFRDIGQPLEYMALQNEPSLNSVMSPEMMKDVVGKLGARLRANGLATRLVIPDDVNVFNAMNYAAPILGDPNTRQYVGALAYHSYENAYDQPEAIARTSEQGQLPPAATLARAKLRALAEKYQVPLWMTEVSSNTPTAMSDFDRALGRANHVHDELTQTNVSAFDQMLLFFIRRPNWEETLLYVYFSPDGSLARYEISPYGYLLGQYAREIVPGSVRVDASSLDPRIRVSAFQRPDGKVVFVIINNRADAKTVTVQIRGATTLPAQFRVRTSTALQMWHVGAPLSNSEGFLTLTLAARSVTTVAP